ncbi:MAG: hypothetical protein ABF489_07795 [Bifidobacterium sp.]|uniref:hypothetical protein n=1 Tax=Bifidobacterium sp. TaxID=41200 RepID=UPI0039E91BC0
MHDDKQSSGSMSSLSEPVSTAGDASADAASKKSIRHEWYWILTVPSVFLLVLGTLFIVHVVQDARNPYLHRPTTNLQSLTTGVAPDGTRWQISSKLTEGSLCLEVETASDPKHPNKYGLDAGGGGACGFDNTRMVQQQYSFMFEALPPQGDDEFMMLAPAPANAVRVQIAEHQSVPTHVIPGSLYRGVRYWYFAYPKNWPNSTSGKECDILFDKQKPTKGHCKIQAYDKNGEVVPFSNHYLYADSAL